MRLGDGLIDAAWEEGREEGLKKGRREGRYQGRYEHKRKIAANLISKTGRTNEQIADTINESVGFVLKIRQEINKYYEEGNKDGNKAGRNRGYQEGRNAYQEEIVVHLHDKKKMTDQQIAELTDIAVDQISKIVEDNKKFNYLDAW